MNAKLLGSICIALLWQNICTAQTNYSAPTKELFTLSQEPFRGVQFSISLNSSIMAIGSTNYLKCQITNQSTNDIGVAEMTSIANTFFYIYAYLTNNSGYCLRITKNCDPNAHENTSMAIDNQRVLKGDVYKWITPVVIADGVKLGDYELKANQLIVTSNYKYYWTIDGNTLAVKIVK